MLRKILGFGFSLALAACLALAQPAAAADIALDGFLRGLCSTATATGNGTAATATLNNKCGIITSEVLAFPTASNYALTLTNSSIAAADIVLWSVSNGTNTTGVPGLAAVAPAAGSVVFNVRHQNSTTFGGTIKINYFVLKP